ncbi:MAG: S26 family signal peptidase [Nannocystis sp.]|nr:S26 family signal peptidase [Nannocystis sp.]MBA3550442.1 S26 family signal peptidase [Nannocystis sp.]
MIADTPARGLWAGLGLVAVVRGPSQEPVLRSGDVVLALRRWRAPRRGDLILVDMGGYLAIKRVAASDPASGSAELEFPAGERRRVAATTILARVVLGLTWRDGRAAWLRT